MLLRGFNKFPIISKIAVVLKLQIILNQDFFECTKKTNAMSLQKRGIKMSELWRTWRATHGDFPVLRQPPPHTHISCSQIAEWMNKKTKTKTSGLRFPFICCDADEAIFMEEIFVPVILLLLSSSKPSMLSWRGGGENKEEGSYHSQRFKLKLS